MKLIFNNYTRKPQRNFLIWLIQRMYKFQFFAPTLAILLFWFLFYFLFFIALNVWGFPITSFFFIFTRTFIFKKFFFFFLRVSSSSSRLILMSQSCFFNSAVSWLIFNILFRCWQGSAFSRSICFQQEQERESFFHSLHYRRYRTLLIFSDFLCYHCFL